MTEPVPDTELVGTFSGPDAKATEWSQALHELASAEVYWLSTVRPDRRLHVTPLLAIWLEGPCISARVETSAKRRTSPPTVIAS